MTATVLILGARGRFGRHAAAAFAAAGWRVRRAVRSSAATDVIGLDAADPEAVTAAARGADVIVHAVNPPYSAWARDLPRLTRAVIAAARASGATVLIPGNVYAFGSTMPAVLTEATPMRPDTEKGRLRMEMEGAFRDAGVRTIVLRAGDFLDTELAGNWFDGQIAKPVAKGAMVYPGPLDRMHAWAFLPDLARAAEGLAARRADLAPFEALPFPGLSLTGEALAQAMERSAGKPLTRKAFPWTMLRIAAPAWPLARGLLEMRYLWDTPHRLAGEALAARLPGFAPTPANAAIAAALAPRLAGLSPSAPAAAG